MKQASLYGVRASLFGGVLMTLCIAAGDAWSADTLMDGRVSLRGLFSQDDGVDAKDQFVRPAVGIVFLETDARAENLTDSGLRLVLDGTFVLDATQANERRFGATESLQQTRQFYVELPGLKGKLDLALGRRLVIDSGNTWVDGLEAQIKLSE